MSFAVYELLYCSLAGRGKTQFEIGAAAYAHIAPRVRLVEGLGWNMRILQQYLGVLLPDSLY